MKKNYEIRTSHCILRTFQVADVSDNYVNWLNDPEVNQFLESKYTIWTKESCTEYVKSCLVKEDRYLFGIYDLESGEYIGNASINNINKYTETFSLGLFIGNKKFWGGKAGAESTLAMMFFGFEVLKLRKFFGGAYSNQLASRFILKKIGCIEEAKLKEKYKFEDKFVDQVVYTMTNTEWMQKKHRDSITLVD